MAQNSYYKECKLGTILYIKVKANSRQENISLITENEKNYLLIKIKAVPENGKANKELIDFLSKKFSIAKSQISIKSGEHSTIKQVLLKSNLNGLELPLMIN